MRNPLSIRQAAFQKIISDLLAHGTRTRGKIDDTVISDYYHVFQAHTAKVSESVQNSAVDELCLIRIQEGFIQQGGDEIATRFVGQRHAGLQSTCCT
jgi:hypothetical protein